MKKSIRIINVLHNIACSHEPAANARLSAALIYKNDIVSIGVNQLKSHPFQKEWARNIDSIFLHAEIDAIKNAMKILDEEDIRKSVLWVCRVKADESFGLAKPCHGCMGAIINFGIKKVHYSTGIEGNFASLYD